MKNTDGTNTGAGTDTDRHGHGHGHTDTDTAIDKRPTGEREGRRERVTESQMKTHRDRQGRTDRD